MELTGGVGGIPHPCRAEWSQGLLVGGGARLPQGVTQMLGDTLGASGGTPTAAKGRGQWTTSKHSRHPHPNIRLPPAHLLEGEGEVRGLPSLAGIQQQVSLALVEQGDGAQGDIHLLKGRGDLSCVLPEQGEL